MQHSTIPLAAARIATELAAAGYWRGERHNVMRKDCHVPLEQFEHVVSFYTNFSGQKLRTHTVRVIQCLPRWQVSR
jgi:NADH:ubiquinone oxidoreductase subunit E